MSMHTPAHKYVPQGSVTAVPDKFFEWWRTEGYKIHVADSNSFQFAQRVWIAAQQAKE